MRNKQAHGPYLLGGMCAGAVIAYEMASQLTRAGERVDLVALLDAATPQAKKRARIAKQRLGRLSQALADARGAEGVLVERVRAAVQITSRKLVNALSWEATRRARRWSARARFRLLRELLARQKPWPTFIPALSVRETYDSAEARYVPRALSDARIVLVRARAGEAADTPYREIYVDGVLGWSAVARRLTVVDVEGGHSSMLQEPFVASLAAALMPYVMERSERRHGAVARMRP